MTDMDKLFQRLQGFNLTVDSPQKILISVSALLASVATIAVTQPSSISQFDSIEAEATLPTASVYSIRFRCYFPTWDFATDGWQFEFHFTPVLGTPLKFKLNLSKAIRAGNKGKPIAISASSSLVWDIVVVDSAGNEFISANQATSLCQTNLGDVSEDDMDRAFIFLNEKEES